MVSCYAEIVNFTIHCFWCLTCEKIGYLTIQCIMGGSQCLCWQLHYTISSGVLPVIKLVTSQYNVSGVSLVEKLAN